VAWRIDVAASVRPFVREIDSALRDEFFERGAELSEDPWPLLRRPRPHECDPSLMVFDYESAVVPGLRFSLYFADLDLEAQRLVLVLVRHQMGP
jgi:hypothetical protein